MTTLTLPPSTQSYDLSFQPDDEYRCDNSPSSPCKIGQYSHSRTRGTQDDWSSPRKPRWYGKQPCCPVGRGSFHTKNQENRDELSDWCCCHECQIYRHGKEYTPEERSEQWREVHIHNAGAAPAEISITRNKSDKYSGLKKRYDTLYHGDYIKIWRMVGDTIMVQGWQSKRGTIINVLQTDAVQRHEIQVARNKPFS